MGSGHAQGGWLGSPTSWVGPQRCCFPGSDLQTGPFPGLDPGEGSQPVVLSDPAGGMGGYLAVCSGSHPPPSPLGPRGISSLTCGGRGTPKRSAPNCSPKAPDLRAPADGSGCLPSPATQPQPPGPERGPCGWVGSGGSGLAMQPGLSLYRQPDSLGVGSSTAWHKALSDLGPPARQALWGP